MGIFNFKFGKTENTVAANSADDQAKMAEVVFQNISDGLIMIDGNGVVRMMNPAAAAMTGYPDPASAVGLDYGLVLKLEDKEGRAVTPETNPIAHALRTNQTMQSRDYLLVTGDSERQMAVVLNFNPIGNGRNGNVITFRDITNELEEENERTEFVSTASHEMRTPVASIEGYLGLALNPATATIDDRARQYLQEAHAASQHLGQLFKDLLDTTKLDDGRLKPKLEPVEMTTLVKQLFDEYAPNTAAKHLKYNFGTATSNAMQSRKMEQLLYASVDPVFLREILDNLIGNAVKYTPEGGEIWVNVRGDGDRVLINVTDTGIGIAPDDLGHIFQKFYRVDNSQTRQIGGTGLGLHLVKQRTEALGGKVWAESSFGDGSTFFVSLPRLSDDEYRKLKIAVENQKQVQAFADQNGGAVQRSGVVAATGTTTEIPQATPQVVPQAALSTVPRAVQPVASVQSVSATNSTTVAPESTAATNPTTTPAPPTAAPALNPEQVKQNSV